MTARTNIEWADSTFNPWIGCTKVSPACPHCARGIAPQDRISGTSKEAEAFRRRRDGANPMLAELACKGAGHG